MIYSQQDSASPVGFERIEECKCYVNNRLQVSIPIEIHIHGSYDETGSTPDSNYPKLGLIDVYNLTDTSTVSATNIRILKDKKTIVSSDFDVGDVYRVQYFAAPENTILRSSCLDGDRLTSATIYNWLAKLNDAPCHRPDLDDDINGYSDRLGINSINCDDSYSFTMLKADTTQVGDWKFSSTPNHPFYITGIWASFRSVVDLSDDTDFQVTVTTYSNGDISYLNSAIIGAAWEDTAYLPCNVSTYYGYTGTDEYAYNLYIPTGFMKNNDDFKLLMTCSSDLVTEIEDTNILDLSGLNPGAETNLLRINETNIEISVNAGSSWATAYTFAGGMGTGSDSFLIGASGGNPDMISSVNTLLSASGASGTINVDNSTYEDWPARYLTQGTYTDTDEVYYAGFAAQVAGWYHT